MRPKGFLLMLATLLAPGMLFASPIFSETGAWKGEGRLVAGVDAPLERGRCKVEVIRGDSDDDVKVNGKCAVAGAASRVAMRFIRETGGSVRAGFWSAATDQTIQMQGRDDDREMTLNSLEPVILDDVSYRSRITLGFPDPDHFTMQQLIRAEDETAWRLVVDMTFQRAPDS